MRTLGTLPEMKPSKLIATALADLAKVERSRRYYVYMGTWHGKSIISGQKCAVCLAGAVMAKTLRALSTCYCSPAVFDGWTRDALYALNNFRQGLLRAGLMSLCIALPAGLAADVDVAPYDNKNPKPFYRDMRRVIKTLKEHGL